MEKDNQGHDRLLIPISVDQPAATGYFKSGMVTALNSNFNEAVGVSGRKIVLKSKM